MNIKQSKSEAFTLGLSVTGKWGNILLISVVCHDDKAGSRVLSPHIRALLQSDEKLYTPRIQ